MNYQTTMSFSLLSMQRYVTYKLTQIHMKYIHVIKIFFLNAGRHVKGSLEEGSEGG